MRAQSREAKGYPVGSSSADVTALLAQLSKGDKSVVPRLMPLVYDELRQLAGGYMRQERGDHTLQPTALVHEAYLKLVAQRELNWKNRAHFFAVAAQLMRRILIDHARTRIRAKRGGGQTKLSFDDLPVMLADRPRELLALDEALQALEKIDENQSRIVELRFFGGLTVDETAEVVGLSARTVEREWNFARAWLFAQLRTSAPPLPR
jgi:RNA polymerase sigma-70 factor (ECF subfamily)